MTGQMKRPCSKADPPVWERMTEGRPSKSFVSMQAAQERGDFDRACQIVAQQARSIARHTRQEAEQAGVYACWTFWEAVAQEAVRARCVYAQGQGWPPGVAVAYLRGEGLGLYADALSGAVEWTALVW